MFNTPLLSIWMTADTKSRELSTRREKTGTHSPDMTDVMDGIRRKARDHARNPLQWSSSHNAGFSLGSKDAKAPWMRVHDDYPEWNVEKQQNDPDSVLSFWKKMLKFRKKYLSCVSRLS
jgi:oligo-1,6-glucosidase